MQHSRYGGGSFFTFAASTSTLKSYFVLTRHFFYHAVFPELLKFMACISNKTVKSQSPTRSVT